MAPRAAEYVPGWWGSQWLQYMAACGVEAQTEGRRKSALRADLRLGLSRGQIRALVAAGMGEVEVVLRVRPISDRDWQRLLRAVAGDAAAAQRLLSGNPGPELAEHCERVGLALFRAPQPYGAIRCTCRNWNCRHMNALAQQGAMLLDANPYLWLEVLGRPRAELFAELRARLADAGAGGPAGEPLAAECYWQTATDPETIAVQPGRATAPAALLAALGPLPLPPEQATVTVLRRRHRRGRTAEPGLMVPEDRDLDAVLEQYITRIARGAAALARGELALPAAPAAPAALPGKPVALAPRLVPEVVAAARQADRALPLSELHQLCPTAAPLPPARAWPALAESFPHLPPDLAVLAGHYVGQRTVLLAGAVLHHVVSFDEQLRGDFNADADWVGAPLAAGCRPPYQVMAAGRLCIAPAAADPGGGESLFARLNPEVGDRVTLRVVDPVTPRLAATLHRRGLGGPDAAPPAGGRAAAAVLLEHMAATRRAQLTEADAVAVLLAEGIYRRAEPAGPVWLLPLQSAGLSWLGRGRVISSGWSQWRPEVVLPHYGYWAEKAAALRWYAADLMQAGQDRREVERALALVERWCAFWPGAQDTPAGAAPLGNLLGYLWIHAPLQTGGCALLPAALGRWFTVLTQRYPAVRTAYAAHIQACSAVQAYTHRCQTLPPAADTAGRLAWQWEGYLWIGASLCFAPSDAVPRPSM